MDQWVYWIIGLVILIIEFVLVKTTWVKPNSIIEWILEILVKIGKAIVKTFNTL